MSEFEGRDWTAMTPADFDPDAPLLLDVGTGPVVVPAVSAECGTPPMFGVERPARRAARSDRRPAAPVDQDGLF
ncbi:hypothetical protein [Streptomyces sp. NPDC060035]|uniref:hypothetical protein n=1 Tax=Streptomyces sp. NPDC060035 TaxID=3347044 RepID=UPI0036B6E139